MSEHQPVEGTEAIPHKENVLTGYRDKKRKPKK